MAKKIFRWPLITLLILIVYFGIRINSLSNVLPKVKETDDTPSYIRASKSLPWSLEAQIRAPTYPMLIALAGGDLRNTAKIQTVISILSWGWLAFAVSRNFRTRIFSFLGLIAILIFSLDKHIIGWDTVIQTESLSISLLCVLIGLWIYPPHAHSWPRLLSILFVGFLWVFTRDTNAYLLFAAGLILLLLVFLRRLPSRYVTLSLGFGMIFFLSYLSFTTGARWVYPFQNMLAKRVLNNSQSIKFFVDCGMPEEPSLLAFANARNTVINSALNNDPAFSSYRAWRDKNGRGCYTSWLLSAPFQTLMEPILNFNEIIDFPEIDRFFQNKFAPVLPVQLARIVYPENFALGLLAFSFLLQIVGLALDKSENKFIWLFLIASSLLLYPHMFIIFHGDTNDVSRHAMTASVQLLLGFWLSVIFLAEHFFLNSSVNRINQESEIRG